MSGLVPPEVLSGKGGTGAAEFQTSVQRAFSVDPQVVEYDRRGS